ncbi:uncharacterized protein LOC102802171 [Saccoglossus kowalevskii]|uniref:Uncharacterized protein LOC102802171 n=1 Tax=Saccoglossus kowalevskii TaxID=10224 RepID=A0ABM0LWZ7_SACKO|nr:PREDICTED: uncharacterized protein LOC102802171 [Saccoglossus kowalevskii]
MTVASLRFGEELPLKTRDDLFQDMGQTTIEQFSVENNEVVLDIRMEDTPGDTAEETPVCRIITPGFCSQSWEFKFELGVDSSNLNSETPVGALGSFEFEYYTHKCEDLNNNTGCTQMDTEANLVAAEVTVQTVVVAVDEDKDGITLNVVKMTNENGEDLRGGKGVNHGENVTVEVSVSPAFLRVDFTLELQLFVTCIGEYMQYSTKGCLAAPSEQSFTSFVDEDLSFKYDPDDDPIFGLSKDEIEEIYNGLKPTAPTSGV